MSKKYLIRSWLGEVGWTNLEYGDPPMGCVGGNVVFTHYKDGYEFFLKHKSSKNVEVYDHEVSDEYFNSSFKQITIISEGGTVIEGQGVNFTGCPYETNIDIIGIPYPFYEEEFPDQCHYYKNQFNDRT